MVSKQIFVGVIDGVRIGTVSDKMQCLAYLVEEHSTKLLGRKIHSRGHNTYAPIYYKHVSAERVEDLTHSLPSIVGHITGRSLVTKPYACPEQINTAVYMEDAVYALLNESDYEGWAWKVIEHGPGLNDDGFYLQYGMDTDATFDETSEFLRECARRVNQGLLEAKDVHASSTIYEHVQLVVDKFEAPNYVTDMQLRRGIILDNGNMLMLRTLLHYNAGAKDVDHWKYYVPHGNTWSLVGAQTTDKLRLYAVADPTQGIPRCITGVLADHAKHEGRYATTPYAISPSNDALRLSAGVGAEMASLRGHREPGSAEYLEHFTSGLIPKPAWRRQMTVPFCNAFTDAVEAHLASDKGKVPTITRDDEFYQSVVRQYESAMQK